MPAHAVRPTDVNDILLAGHIVKEEEHKTKENIKYKQP